MGTWAKGCLLVSRCCLQRQPALVLPGAPARDVRPPVLWPAVLRDLLQIQPVSGGLPPRAGEMPVFSTNELSSSHGNVSKEDGNWKKKNCQLLGMQVWVCVCGGAHLCTHKHIESCRIDTWRRQQGSLFRNSSALHMCISAKSSLKDSGAEFAKC